MNISYIIVFVSDMKRSISFYRDLIGLPVKFESTHWTEFATDGATLALHLSDEINPDSGNSGRSPAGSCRLGLSMTEIEKFHNKMLKHNVPCIQEPKETFGTRIAQYLDPDGMPFSVSEEATIK